MTGFSADWLRLREPFDHAARQTAAGATALLERIGRWRERAPGRAFAVVDLACGHGANMRALAPLLGGAQHWRLVDHDPALLAAVPEALAAWARQHNYRLTVEDRAGEVEPINIIGPNFHAKVERQRVDLAIDLPRLDFSEATLVTASALLDLVSASWLQTLICKAKATRVAMLFALNVDGPITWDPGDPADEHVHALFSRHQNRDKGFGPALGSQAVAIALHRMASAGYQTQQTRTDWLIDGAQAPEMQLAMVQGMAVAALEQDPTTRDAVQSWKARRGASIGVSRLRVGHVDIVATPT